MEEKYKKQKLHRLDINDHVIETLENNEINTIGKVCIKSKTDLKKIGLEQFEINKLEIELQLLGLGLKNSL